MHDELNEINFHDKLGVFCDKFQVVTYNHDQAYLLYFVMVTTLLTILIILSRHCLIRVYLKAVQALVILSISWCVLCICVPRGTEHDEVFASCTLDTEIKY